ncbi:hypothetical protein B0H13DRAFT_1862925 [Mycena leptocephala]|nr:hypothetical protein B0H13DRAFT_1862925 [Mycena leptocephala]
MSSTSTTEPISSALRCWIWSPLRCSAQAFNSRIINPWRTQLHPEKPLRIDHPSVQGRIKLVKEVQGTWRARLRMRRRRGTGLSEQEEKKRHPCFMQWFAPDSNGLPQAMNSYRPLVEGVPIDRAAVEQFGDSSICMPIEQAV